MAVLLPLALGATLTVPWPAPAPCTQAVVVATRDLPAGHVLREDDVGVERRACDAIVADSHAETLWVIGQTSLVSLGDGEIVRGDRLVSSPQVGSVPVTLGVAALMDPWLAKLELGEWIDIQWIGDRDGFRRGRLTLLQGVVVSHVDVRGRTLTVLAHPGDAHVVNALVGVDPTRSDVLFLATRERAPRDLYFFEPPRVPELR